MQEAVFAAGDFWEVEDGFRRLEGVVSTKVGYAGGSAAPGSHEDVIAGKTGHALVVQLTYDPKRVSYDELLSFFWNLREPAEYLDKGEDHQPHRCVIFTTTEEQAETAEASRYGLERSRAFGPGAAVQTPILSISSFFAAPLDYQRYLGHAEDKAPEA